VLFSGLFFAGIIVAYAVWFTTLMPVFWTNRLFNISDIFGELRDTAQYPLDLYTSALRIVFTFVVPFAFMTTFPAKALLGQVVWWWLPVAIFMASATLFASSRLWQFALKRYSGASA